MLNSQVTPQQYYQIMMDKMNNNQLLNAYSTYQNNTQNAYINSMFQTNPLLSQPIIQTKQNYLMDQMKTAQEIDQIKKLQQPKGINKRKGNEQDDMVRDMIIRPVKIKENNQNVKQNYDFISSTWEQARDTWWTKKTNQPYKNIIPQKDEKHTHGFDYKQIINPKEEYKLIIHTVTQNDKVGADNRLDELKTTIESQDSENKVIYSQDKYLKHKKDFDYEHVYYYKVKCDSKGHVELKEERLVYHEQKQKEKEEGKKKLDTILESLQNDDLLNDVTIKDERKEDIMDDVSIDKLIEDTLNTQQVIDKETHQDDRTANQDLTDLLDSLPSDKHEECVEIPEDDGDRSLKFLGISGNKPNDSIRKPPKTEPVLLSKREEDCEPVLSSKREEICEPVLLSKREEDHKSVLLSKIETPNDGSVKLLGAFDTKTPHHTESVLTTDNYLDPVLVQSQNNDSMLLNITDNSSASSIMLDNLIGLTAPLDNTIKITIGESPSNEREKTIEELLKEAGI
jgi:hypothetical protein